MLNSGRIEPADEHPNANSETPPAGEAPLPAQAHAPAEIKPASPPADDADARPPDGAGDAANAGARPRRRTVLREISVLFIILAGFLLTSSTVLSPRVIPFNCDEIDTFFEFIPKQSSTRDKPWIMTASYSGMYNLTFWARCAAVGGPDDLENGGYRNRALNLAIASVLLLALYGFGRWILDAKFGLILMFTAAFAHMTFFITIEGNYLNETSLATLLSIWAYLAGEKTRSRWLKLLLGLACGSLAVVSGLLYFSGRMILPALFCHGAAMQFQDRKWIRRSAPLLLGVLALTAPAARRFIQDQKAQPGAAQYRQRGTQILYRGAIDKAMDQYHTDSVASAVVQNIAESFMAYKRGANQYHAYTTPHGYLDAVSFWLGALGFCWAIWRWRNPAWLLLLMMFVVNNALLGGLTWLPFPPYHQRVHFGILLSYLFVALPLWALTRAPRRWGTLGQGIAGLTLIGIGVWNSHLYFSRVFDAKDPYLHAQGLMGELSNYLIPLARDHDIFGANCGLAEYPDPATLLIHHNVQDFHPDCFIRSFEYYLENIEYFKTRSEIKPPLFAFLRGDGPCAADRVEGMYPGGRWLRFHEDGKPFLDVYIPPRTKPADGNWVGQAIGPPHRNAEPA